jgi:hypothetical protein
MKMDPMSKQLKKNSWILVLAKDHSIKAISETQKQFSIPYVFALGTILIKILK